MRYLQSSHWLAAVAAVVVLSAGPRLAAQPPGAAQQRQRPEPKMDPERAKKLYVSNNPDDHSLGRDFQRDIDEKKKTDARFAEASKGVIKPDLAETKIYVDPPPGSSGGGHTFSRRTDLKTLERMDTPEQRDSWNRTWAFFEWHLRPYEDRSKSATSQQ